MAILTGQIIVDEISTALQDINADRRWPTADLLEYINSGAREIERLAPHLVSATSEVALVAGCMQTIPAGSGRILNNISLPMYNKGVGGGVIGSAITSIQESSLALFNPNWQVDAAAGVAVHFMTSEEAPYQYKVWPAQPVAPASIDITTSVIPVNILLTGLVPVSDRHANALRDYGLYRAFSMETTASDKEKATAYYQLFLSGIKG